MGSFLGILFTAVLPQARHLAQLRTLSDPPGGLGQGQDLTSRGRGRNHDHEETTDDELGTNIVSIPTPNPLPNLGPTPELGKHCPVSFLWILLSPCWAWPHSPAPASPTSSLYPMPQPSEEKEAGGTLKRRPYEEQRLQVRLLGLAIWPHHSSVSAGHHGHQKAETLPEDPASVCLH